MRSETPTISIRLPKASLKTLDKAAKSTRRSRSFLVREALDQHLQGIVEKQAGVAPKPLTRLMAMRGIALKLRAPRRTAEEINAHIRWLRDSE